MSDPAGSAGWLLATPRLRLRPMQPGDLDALLAIFGDPRVMAAFDEPPFDRAQMARWLQRNLDHQAAHGYGLFAVLLRPDGLLIGDCGLEIMEIAGTPTAELGYDFRADYWHQGYATEAAIAVRDYAFADLGLARLVSLIRVGNEASRHVAERVGMHLAQEIARYGRPYWVYALDRPAAP